MDMYIAYFDETGDDGANTSSSDVFVLTSVYMNAKNNEPLPKRVEQVIDSTFINRTMATFENGGILNLKAGSEKYGLVVYPK